MPIPNRKKHRKARMNRILLAGLSFLIVVCLAASAIFLFDKFLIDHNEPEETISTPSYISTPSEPEKITKIATATIVSTGDLLMHEPIINSAKSGDGEYDFNNIFTYFGDYVKKADYATANLETTLRGNQDGYKFSGYPQFNCPDSIVDASKAAGFDMLLTANNHSYDTRLKGFLRTLEVIDSKQLDRIGTTKDETAKKYIVKDINGIKIGMICYTYETDNSVDKVALNGIPLGDEAKGLINAFSYGELDAFYEKLGTQLNDMQNDGAEALVVFIHWGEEYNIKQNKTQEAIAQKLCNLGVDVIVGGHSHVVQPIELLTSEEDPEHKTACLYSMGNAVSNQRRERMNLKTGHTEDGLSFGYTFAKYSDGTVMLESIEVLPTWVNMYTSKATGRKVYEIIPLDTSVSDWKQAFDMTDTSEPKARDSYDRTMKIVGEGLKVVNEYLSSVPTPDDEVPLIQPETSSTVEE